MDRAAQSRPRTTEAAAVVAAARAGDEAAFGALVEPYRRELHVHCYRMLASFEDAEDLVQETFLRAWRKRGGFQGRSSFRAWLYRIATNACLDALERRPRIVAAHGRHSPWAEIPWLQPYPDELLEEIAPVDAQPEAEVVARETMELAFIAAIQHLSPRQRAVLIARDVLGWSAAESASLLDVSVAAVNSALQRARARLQERLPRRRLDWAPGSEPSDEERALLQRYVEANERNDPAAMVQLLREDALFAMPPAWEWWLGREAVVASWVRGGFGSDSWGRLRLVPTRANGRPAFANYIRRPGERDHRAMALDVLRIEDGLIAEVIAFGPDVFAAFGLPRTLS
ncbi:MAG: sigma-70 family RNA polymerase sigma factor [Gaiellaceae bacterium]